MAIGRRGEIIQAVEVVAKSTIGIVTNIPGANTIIHAIEDTNITFTFKDVDDKVVSALAGSDWVGGSDCLTISTTGIVVAT